MESVGTAAEFIETAKLSLARALVELVQDDGSIRQCFDVGYRGAGWEAVVRTRASEHDVPSGSPESDLTEQLTESPSHTLRSFVMAPKKHPEDVPETGDTPEVDRTSEQYALGFDVGTEGKPCDGETPEWRRGWADAQ